MAGSGDPAVERVGERRQLIDHDGHLVMVGEPDCYRDADDRDQQEAKDGQLVGQVEVASHLYSQRYRWFLRSEVIDLRSCLLAPSLTGNC